MSEDAPSVGFAPGSSPGQASSPVNGGASGALSGEGTGSSPAKAGEGDHAKHGGGGAAAPSANESAPSLAEIAVAQPRPRRRWPRIVAWVSAGAAVLVLAGLVAGYFVVRDIEKQLPSPPDPKTIAASTVVLDRDGRLLRPFTTADGLWRLPVTRDQVDKRFLAMLIGYEDRNFATHHGVDYQALVRAAGQFVLAGGHVVSGGSTLTMQVARLLDGASTKDAWSKLRQILMAEKIEASLSKDQILNLYLQLAPYGGNIEGVRAASLAYFGKEPTRLTVAEAALLVALPQSPEARRPDHDASAARQARDRVLDRLVAAGVIDPDSAMAAKSEKVPDARRPFPMFAPHLAEEAVAARAAAPDSAAKAQAITLTIDRDLQASLEGLAKDRIGGLGPKLSVAIVVADHRSGAILASVGSAGLFEDARAGHVDMTEALRSPGSTLKPLIYGLAFEQGLAHPESHNGLTVLQIRAGTPPTIATAWCGAVRGAGSPIVTTTDGNSNPIVWILGAEGDNRLHGFRGDTGEPLFNGPGEAMTGLRHFQTLIATKNRLYVGADGRVYAFSF
jgi:membrane peptidoglycan carboxypeptidase